MLIPELDFRIFKICFWGEIYTIEMVSQSINDQRQTDMRLMNETCDSAYGNGRTQTIVQAVTPVCNSQTSGHIRDICSEAIKWQEGEKIET